MFGEEHNVTLSVEWVPREQNTLADELSKLIISNDWMLASSFFRWLEDRWGTHAADLFASDANNQCGRFYSLHWCRGDGGSKRVRLLMGRGTSVGELPLHASRPSLAEAETRRSHGHCASAVVGVRHVEGTCCARYGAFF